MRTFVAKGQATRPRMSAQHARAEHPRPKSVVRTPPSDVNAPGRCLFSRWSSDVRRLVARRGIRELPCRLRRDRIENRLEQPNEHGSEQNADEAEGVHAGDEADEHPV